MVAYLSLGSNLGDRSANLQEAVDRLQAYPHVEVIRVSPCYLTEPAGYREQPWFLNLAAEVDIVLEPREFLRILQAVERGMGRTRPIHWGPRVIDLDLLMQDDREIREPDLVLPHPRLLERGFVLVPLADLVPELRLPNGERLKTYLENNNFAAKVLPYPGGTVKIK